MADDVTQTAEVESDAQALASAQAGYDKTARGDEPPVEQSTQASGRPPLADSVQAPPQDTPAPEPEEPNLEAEPAAPDAIAAVSQQLAALRGQVQELTVGGAEVRKLHGEIGNINRTLKQLQAAKPGDAPADEDELAAALKNAEKVAEEFPEIAGPLVKALKAFHAKAALAKPEPEADPEPQAQHAQTSEAQPIDLEVERQKARQQAAIDAINELHPDRFKVKESPEFKSWIASKTPEYQQRFWTSWNPAVVAQTLDEFKASRTARTRRQERLDAATQPQGTGVGGPSTIPDEEGFRIGYERAGRGR